VDRKATVSGLVALPGAAALALWAISFSVPAVLDRQDLIPVYRAVLYSSVPAPLLAGVWRRWAGPSWHANGALLVSLAAMGFTCCGILYAAVKVTPAGW
jgi:hypothetical protein